MERLIVCIPSYNARPFLRETVSRIPWRDMPPDLACELLFIDNASADGTPEEIQRVRENLAGKGIPSRAILHDHNRGYGGSMKAAFDAARQAGADYLAIVHADGQYAPELLPALLARLRPDPACALLFGSRLTGDPLAGGMPLYKFFANHALSTLQNLLLGARLSEYHSGYRLYRVPLLERLPYQGLSNGFVFDNQIIYQILEAGFGILETPIPTHYGAEKSHVPRIGTPLAILSSLAVYVLHRSGLRRSGLYTIVKKEDK